METNLYNLYGGSNDGPEFWASYRHEQARKAAVLAEKLDSQRRLEACLLRWHEVFQASPGLLERMS